ncbi:hypothetical protein [Actinophytocola sp.]|uniref:hypothetical protein n=1 Tax=Actinophytocola sp. TaxID=1872138 RepID=UPI00389A09B8
MCGRIAATAIGITVTAVLASGLTGCGIFGGKHEVGECVRTKVGVGGTDIETVDCPAGGSAFDNPGDPVYRITAVLDYDASCPADGKYGIELKHEPDDAVYCLDILE